MCFCALLRDRWLLGLMICPVLIAIPDSARAQGGLRYYADAAERYDRRDLAGALASVNLAIERAPKREEAYELRALIRLEQGEFPGALADAQRWIELRPKDSSAHALLAKIKVLSGDADGGFQAANRAVELDARNFLAFEVRAMAYSMRGELDLGVQDCDRAIKLNEDAAEAYSTRGRLKLALGDVEGAQADAGRVIELWPAQGAGYYDRACLRHATGDFNGALADCNQALRFGGEHAPLYALRASISCDQGNFDAAARDAERSLQLGEDAEAYLVRGILHLNRQEATAAEADFAQAMRLKPHDGNVLFTMGNAMAQQGRFQEALPYLDRAIAILPAPAKVYASRAKCRASLQDYDGAHRDAQRAIDLAPDLPDGHLAMCVVSSLTGDRQGAVAAAEKAVRCRQDAATVGARALARWEAGDTEGAMEDTQLTMKQSQAVNPSMLALRGLIKIDHLDWEGAQRDIDQALRELPQSDLALMARAKLKNELGDYQGALVDANASIALSPGPGPYCQRGIARLSLGEIDGAMADFNGVITAEPTMGEAYRNRAAARCMKAELDGALADLEKAIQYEPKPADAFTMRGYVHFLLGHWDEAESDLGSSIRLAPPGNEAHRTRGWVRLAKRNWDGAEEDFQAAGQDDDAQLRWIWMSQARGGDPSAAARQLASTRKGGTSGESGAWSGLLTDFILGKRTQEEVLAASAADPSQAGQFWFFAGQLRLLAKDDAGAAEAFRACRAKSHSQSPEAQLAGVELSSGPGRE